MKNVIIKNFLKQFKEKFEIIENDEALALSLIHIYNPYPHHNPKVLFDESAMTWGAAMHAQCAFEWLRNHK